MEKEKIVVFLDYANINRASSDNDYYLNYEDLLSYLAEGRFLIDAHCYFPLDPRNEHKYDHKINQLWEAGYLVNTKIGRIAGDNYKCDFDVEITMDILRIAYQVKPDIIVLASGDVDFVPVILELRKLGIRVEVASFESSMSGEVINKSSGFISLDTYCNECLNFENDDHEENNPAHNSEHPDAEEYIEDDSSIMTDENN